MKDLLLMPVLKSNQQRTLKQWLHTARGNKMDLTDLLIAHSAKTNGCEGVIIFDKDVVKFNLYDILK
jgi:predicted nucleic-acid-binding protein